MRSCCSPLSGWCPSTGSQLARLNNWRHPWVQFGGGGRGWGALGSRSVGDRAAGFYLVVEELDDSGLQ